MPNLKTVNAFLGENRSWIGAEIGIKEARVVVAVAAEFDGNIIASGTPVTFNTDGHVVPYTDGTKLAGIILTDKAKDVDPLIACALYYIGSAYWAKLHTDEPAPPSVEDNASLIAWIN